VFLNPEEFFVKRKDFGRACATGGRELALGVREDFVEMTRH
jgi:hypothetical protein